MIYTNFQNDKLSLLGFGAMRLPLLADGSVPCTACRYCVDGCPMKIDIPACMEEFADILGNMQHWEELCKIRAEAAKKAREARMAGK